MDEIEKAFSESQVPIAYKAELVVKLQDAVVTTVPIPKVTKNAVLYIRYGPAQPD